MILVNAMLFIVFLVIVIKSADYCAGYATQFAKKLQLSEFIISFYVISLISALPETSISIFSALNGVPELALGTLLGSNIADLTLVFGITALMSANGVHVKSQILKKNFFYLVLLLFPVLLGRDGYFSRENGIILVLGGSFFFFTLSMESRMFRKKLNHLRNFSTIKNLALISLSMMVLVISANYTVEYAMAFAQDIKMPVSLIGLTMISIGTCLPELIFAIRAVRNNHEELALGDVLGTVITDTTIILGIVAIIRPFYFDPSIIYLTGITMFFAGLLAIVFISSEKTLSKREGVFLLFFYIIYLVAEFVMNKIT